MCALIYAYAHTYKHTQIKKRKTREKKQISNISNMKADYNY